MKIKVNVLFLIFTVISITGYSQSTIKLTEIHYNSDSTKNTGDWFELYNTGNSPVDLSLYRLRDSSLTGLYLVTPGTIIGPQQYLVFCADTVAFDAVYNITNRKGNLGYGLNNNADGIRVFDQNNAMVFEVFYQDSLPWPIGADGFGRTLELKNTTLDPALPTSWRTGCVLGSPGGPFIPCTSETIVVSEINYSSLLTEDAGDWFEIRNIGNSAVNIGNYKIRDSKNVNLFVIPSNTVLQPQGSLVVYDTPAKFNVQFPWVSNKVGPFFFNLSGDGDCIRIYDANDKIIFSVYYDDDLPWSEQPDGNGYTLEADTNFNFSRDVCDAQSWFAGCPEGSPGVKYNADCNASIESLDQTVISIYPNPASEFLNINLSEGYITSIQIINAAGQPVRTILHQSMIDVSFLEKGIYFLRIHTNLNMNIQKLIIQ
jgi:hypothetical protein